MRRCSFNAKDALDGLFAENGVTETCSNVRELLVVAPLNLPLVALIVIVMRSSRSGIESLLVVDFLGLGEPGAGRLSESVIELEVLVVQVFVDCLTVGNLVELLGDVALFAKVLGAYLCDVHVNHVGVVAVDFHHLVLISSSNIDVVGGTDVLVRQDARGLAVLVSWRSHVPNLQVASLHLLIDLEEEVLLSDDLLVGVLCQLFAGHLVFEFNQADLLCDSLVDSLADVSQVLGASSLTELSVGSWHALVRLEGV